MFALLTFIIDITLGYLIGSVCSAVIVCRLCHLPDPRTNGSKNPGATNVLRLAGKKYAIIVLLADMLKGFIPVMLAHIWHSSPAMLGITCLAAVLGHIYPVFFNFKGGKGVATALGAILAFQSLMGCVIISIWLFFAYVSGYSSLASLIAISFAPFYSLFIVGNLSAFLPLAMIAGFVTYQHRENIMRLMDGKEPKIGSKSQINEDLM